MIQKKYIFNLDLPEDKRWVPILSDFKTKFVDMNSKITSLLNFFGYNSFFAFIIRNVIRRNASSIMYLGEMKSISEITGIDLEKIFIMQLCYEICASCTTLITQTESKNQEPFFFRTMDWDMIWLKEFTITLSYIRSGKTLFEAPTWLGCVGLFTAYRPGLSIAINFRQVQPPTILTILGNLKRLYQMHWPASYLVRSCLESERSYETIKNMLCKAPLVAPCYYTVFTPNRITDSMIITRGSLDFHVQKFEAKTKFLSQTNCDFDKKEPNILWSLERREMIQKIMTESNWNPTKLTQHLLKYPIINHETIYYCIMYKDKFETFISHV